MKINWKVRLNHPAFYVGVIGIIGNTALQYFGMNASDLTSWSGLMDVMIDTVKNPYLLGSIIFAVLTGLGVVADHTTPGICDSDRAKGYILPGITKEESK